MPDYGTHNYANISRTKVYALLDKVIAHGSHVTGNNPWIIDAKEHGVLLKCAWNEETLTLEITVTDANWYVTRKAVWQHIESLMCHTQDAG